MRRAAITLLLLLSACTGRAGSAEVLTGPQQNSVGGLRGGVFAVADRNPAPVLSGRTVQGTDLDLSSLHGKVIVINFWASWCVPCRLEMPMIERTAAQQRSLVVLLINERDDLGAARRFATELKITSPALFDGDGRVGNVYGVQGLPTTVFVRTDGSIEGRYLGQMSQEVLEAHIAAITG